jgi:hypothetical protein
MLIQNMDTVMRHLTYPVPNSLWPLGRLPIHTETSPSLISLRAALADCVLGTYKTVAQRHDYFAKA